MPALIKFLMAYGWWLSAAAGIVAAAALYVNRTRHFWLTDLVYTFPLIGKIKRYSRDYAESSYTGWLNVEDMLCRDYAKHISSLSKAQFDHRVEYLKKTYDHGRKPVPVVAIAGIVILVILEGFGFSYLLGAAMAAEGSENTRQILMIGITIVLAMILVWVMHSAGHQMFRTNVLRSCFRAFQTCRDDGFTSAVVGLNDPSGIDANKPPHVQCANRVAHRGDDIGGRAWLWVAGALILVIAAGSTYLRIETLAASEIAASSDVGAAMFGGAPAVAPAADGSAASAVSAQHNASLTAYMMLAAIFVTTQIVGIGVGYSYGFAGKQADNAYRATRGCADYESYWEPIQNRINLINSRLKKLQRLLEEGMPRPIDFSKSFPDFIREERTRGATDLHEPPAQALSPSHQGHQSNSENVAGALAEWDHLGPDQDARIAYVKTLRDSMQLDLYKALKARTDASNADRDREIHEKVTAMFADVL